MAVPRREHAIECRIYAEDPDSGFLPSPGRLTRLRAPAGPGVRDDGGYDAPGEVPIYYDSLVSKLVTWGASRQDAIARMRRALAEYEIAGVKTTIPFFTWLLEDEGFLDARVDTTYLDRVLAARNGHPFAAPEAAIEDLAAIGAALDAYYSPKRRTVEAAASAWTRAARDEARR